MDEGKAYRPVLHVLRGGVVESLHHGAVAVADAEGTLHAWFGDPQVVTFLRSSAKPFQALPLLESGAATRLNLTRQQIAVMCGSHIGTPEHVRVVASIQEEVGIEEEQLLCGTHMPFDAATAAALVKEGKDPSPNYHNCSGKHTGMLVLARFLGYPLQDYVHPDHPVQSMIRAAFGEMCGLGQDQVQTGIDGCSAPNFAVPLAVAATAFARLGDPSGLRPSLKGACREVIAAMTSNPEMVAGNGQLDTELMRLCSGLVLGKGGAEGYQGLALLPGSRGSGSRSLGVAVKIADGNQAKRALGPVVLAVLEALGVLGSKELSALSPFGPQILRNHRRMAVGETRVCMRLESGNRGSGG